jgi:hypothetical protein
MLHPYSHPAGISHPAPLRHVILTSDPTYCPGLVSIGSLAVVLLNFAAQKHWSLSALGFFGQYRMLNKSRAIEPHHHPNTPNHNLSPDTSPPQGRRWLEDSRAFCDAAFFIIKFLLLSPLVFHLSNHPI